MFSVYKECLCSLIYRFVLHSKKKSSGKEEETKESWQEQKHRHGRGGGRG